MICNICSHVTIPFAKAVLLGIYNVQYFQCQHCKFIQTEEPYWLHEAYSDAIAKSDIGLVGRNLGLSRISAGVISLFFDGNARFVDYGGGYGLFVRLMRDNGFDFYRKDKFCTNLFASDFEADDSDRNKYELVTAFEVFEHLVHPLDEIEQMLQFSKNIFFSTILIPTNDLKPNEWWYYSLQTGQHVSLYTLKSLRIIAEKLRLNLYTDGLELHLLTEKVLPAFLFKIILNPRLSALLRMFYRRKSLIPADFKRSTRKNLI
jgi:hypothetical protein